ncbi:MAG: 3'-5' exonuclease [Anaerolineae bacterium]|nr:3'-5' exonuclease [Anaerolineae bacterium]
MYLDTETTGLASQDEIVDICLVSHDGTILVDSLVKPTIPIPADASRIHGISNEMVKHSPTWADLWPELKRHLLGRPLAIYNADYDLKMIEQTQNKWNIQWRVPRGNSLCIMRLYAQFFGDWNPSRRSYRWQKLGDAAKQCGIKIKNTHRAKDDTLLAKAVLEYMAEST